jgi:hypothetical protein
MRSADPYDDDPPLTPHERMIDAANQRMGAKIATVITRSLTRLGVDHLDSYVRAVVADELRQVDDDPLPPPRSRRPAERS